MRILVLTLAGVWLAGCASWSTLNTDDMLAEAKERSAQTSQRNAQTHWQDETFGSLAALAGETFRGEPMTAAGEVDPDGVADIQSWAWSDDGKEIIISHGLEDGSYGGVTRIYPNGEANELAYRYVTNAGFETVGSFTLDETGGWEAMEAVEGHDTITHVRSRGYKREDGALMSEAEYLTADGWQPGHGFVYTPFDGEVPEVRAAGE